VNFHVNNSGIWTKTGTKVKH